MVCHAMAVKRLGIGYLYIRTVSLSISHIRSLCPNIKRIATKHYQLSPLPPQWAFFMADNKAWHSKPYAHASSLSALKQSMALTNPKHNGDTVEVVDLGDVNAMRYSFAISILAKYAVALVVTLSLITSSTSLKVAVKTIATSKRYANLHAMLRKLIANPKKFRI